MPPRVKICGLSTKESVNVALEGGAALLGFVFFRASPRYVAPEAAAQLAGGARRSGVKTVAVMVDPDDEAVSEVAAAFSPDFIQLHGRETPHRAEEVRARSGAGIIKAVRVASAADVTRGLTAFDGAADHLLFDAPPPDGAELPGGNGAAFDWSHMAEIRPTRPWFLAGGLNPWNAAEAARVTRAPMLDVSSGVERGPGIKNPALIAAFLSAVQRA